jgi:hypothetical protein
MDILLRKLVVDYIVKSGSLWYKKPGFSLSSLFEGLR